MALIAWWKARDALDKRQKWTRTATLIFSSSSLLSRLFLKKQKQFPSEMSHWVLEEIRAKPHVDQGPYIAFTDQTMDLPCSLPFFFIL